MDKASRRKKKTNGKGGSKGANEAIRKRLLEHRQEILDMYQHDLRVGQESSEDGTEDIVDRANNSYQREFMFSLSDAERQKVFQIEGAIKRLDSGAYGTCDHCGEKLAKARLKAIPWARYCVDCQEKVEQGALSES